MEDLKKFELTNLILNKFDEVMTYHLDEVEELEIKEILSNSKLYNIISLCMNVKKLFISGDMRIDVNKILSNLGNAENLEILILDSVKLPTTKNLSKFTNLNTIVLKNITYNDSISFLNKLPTPNSLIAISLENVDMMKKSISSLEKFKKLQFLNINGIKNCKFDSFEFLGTNKNIQRFEFRNSVINIENINELLKGKYQKFIDVNFCGKINLKKLNHFRISNQEVHVRTNTIELENFVQNVKMTKIDKLYLDIENKISFSDYIKDLKKVKSGIELILYKLYFLNKSDLDILDNKLKVQKIRVFHDEKLELFNINEYKILLNKLLEIASNDEELNEYEKVKRIYNYFLNDVEFRLAKVSLKKFIKESVCSYNLYNYLINDIFILTNIECNLINGAIDKKKGFVWNQVKINDSWYNLDLGYDAKLKCEDKAIDKNILKNDAIFNKNHVALCNNVKVCDGKLLEKKDYMFFIKMLCYKIKSLFNFNKTKALPTPNNFKEG